MPFKSMKTKLTFLFLFLYILSIAGDPSLMWGKYRSSEFELQLQPNGSFLLYPVYARCGLFLPRKVSGVFTTNGDTIFLKESAESNWQKKLVQKRDTNQKYAHEEWINLNRFLEEQSPVQKADQQDNDQNKMSREFPSNKYYPFSAYYQNGQLAWLSSYAGDYQTKLSYYDNGNLSEVFTYQKQKKSGIWAYYNYNGSLKFIEEYRRNKKIKTFTS